MSGWHLRVSHVSKADIGRYVIFEAVDLDSSSTEIFRVGTNSAVDHPTFTDSSLSIPNRNWGGGSRVYEIALWIGDGFPRNIASNADFFFECLLSNKQQDLRSLRAFVSIDIIEIDGEFSPDPKILSIVESFERSDVLMRNTVTDSEEFIRLCQPCHENVEKQGNFKSLHSSAYTSIVHAKAVGKNRCLDCHTTTVRSFKGDSIRYAGVLCSHCHKGAIAHAKGEISIMPLMPVEHDCIACHDKTQSPDFNYKEYLSKLDCCK